MQEYRDYLRGDDRPATFLGLSTVTTFLIIANVASFLALLLAVHVVLPQFFGGRPAELGARALEMLALVPAKAVGETPPWLWQLLTFGFVQDPTVESFLGLGPIAYLLFNMLVLYFFGREAETLYGGRRFLVLYLGATAFAGLFYCIFEAHGRPLAGASGAVFAVMVAYACHFPRERWLLLFLIPVEVWLIATIVIALALAWQVRTDPAGLGALAHLAGAAFGWLFYRLQHPFDELVARLDRRYERAEREHEEEIEARLDTLLEKISRDGMGSLSKRERDFLKRASRHYQKKA